MASCLSCLYCARIQYFRRKPILYCALRGHILKSTAPKRCYTFPYPIKTPDK